jgi:hypothetical protein
MAAVHADSMQTEDPRSIVCKALKQLMGAAYMLAEMDARLRAFDVEAFDLDTTVAGIGLETAAEKRQLLELVFAVNAADEILADDKDEFLKAVAQALRLPADAYGDLTLDIEDRVSLYEARNSLLGPPPLPKN